MSTVNTSNDASDSSFSMDPSNEANTEINSQTNSPDISSVSEGVTPSEISNYEETHHVESIETSETQHVEESRLKSFDSTTESNNEESPKAVAKSKTKKSVEKVIEFLGLGGGEKNDKSTADNNQKDEVAEEPLVADNAFESWSLSKELLKSLAEMKFTNPTAIQTQAIPLLLGRQKDFVGLAATGTGKTGAFGIPLVETIDASSKSVQALVMCPTRELASQVEAQLQKFAKWKGLTTLTVFGGSSYDRQVTALKRGVHIVVGTPGRLCDLIDRKVLKLNDVQTLVLDEADEMISMGFQDDLEKILGAIGDSPDKRKWLFSATMSPEIRRVVSRYLPDYDKIEIHKQDSEKPQIEQIYYTIYPDRKLQMLASVLYMNPEFYGLVFCQTKKEVQEITEWLKRKSFKVDCIHGDRPQRERDFILKDFRSGRVKILVATDVAARGLDINDLTHVINFSLPREVESYVHRIGRTGRAGKKGMALSIVAPHEVRTLKRIQQVTKANLVKGRAPTNDELNLYRVKDAISNLNSIDSKDEVTLRASKFLERKMPELKELFTFEFTVEEFLKRFLVAEHFDIFENRDTLMDFVGDGIVPREMQDFGSKPRGFEGRDRSGPRDSRQFRDNRGGGGYDRPRFSDSRGDSRNDFRSEGRSDSRNESRGGGGFERRSADAGFDRPRRSFNQPDSSVGSFSGGSSTSSSAPTDRFERSERGGRYTGSGGFRGRNSSSGNSSYEGGAPRSFDQGRPSFDNQRSFDSGGRRPSDRSSDRSFDRASDSRPSVGGGAGRTWNADDATPSSDRPVRKRYVSGDANKAPRRS